MNKLLLITALVGVLLQNTVKLCVLMNFAVNRAYIAKNLCVKKDIADNCCQGKCYLEKKIVEQEEKQPASDESKYKEEIQFFQRTTQFVFIPLPVLTDLNGSSKKLLPYDFLQSVFRPPAHCFLYDQS